MQVGQRRFVEARRISQAGGAHHYGASRRSPLALFCEPRTVDRDMPVGYHFGLTCHFDASELSLRVALPDRTVGARGPNAVVLRVPRRSHPLGFLA